MTPLPNPVRLPTDQQRLTIIGATGSGKTQAALWHLSHRRYDEIPWVVYDFKGDDSIARIPYAEELPIDKLPTRPGIFVVRPEPDDHEGVENQMRAIWAKTHTGVYVDEGYMIAPSNRAFRTLLTQGRSKFIPMITLSQRPVWMDRFVFSESEFFQVFRLQSRKDRISMGEIIPASLERQLPEYHSWYYDAGRNRLNIMTPVPRIETINATFARRLGEMLRSRKRA